MTWAGIGPSGTFSTINIGGGIGRIDWEEARGDVSGLIDSLIVIGLRGNLIDGTQPVFGDVLIFDGNNWVPSNSASISGSGPHNLLSITHVDTTAEAPSLGDLIIGSGSPVTWARFPVGLPGQDLRISDGGNVVWSFEPLNIIDSGSIVNLDEHSRRVVVNKSVGSATEINLPPSPIFGQEILIKDGAGNAHIYNINIYPPSGLTIDGLNMIKMAQNYQSFHLLYNGTEWNII